MTDTELKYYTVLQPLFREKMGPIELCDRVMFRGKTGWAKDRQVNEANDRQYSIIQTGFGWIEEQYLERLPLPIDSVNPKRGLWGMVNNLISLTNGSLGSIVTVYDIGGRDRETLFQSANPTEALLMTLAAQEGVEI